MHLRTLLLALALWACLSPPAAAALQPGASEREAPTIGVGGAEPQPFLARGSATLAAAFDLTSSGPQLPQRQSQDRNFSAPVRARAAADPRQPQPGPQHWTVIGPREHHLGTPPPHVQTGCGRSHQGSSN